MSHSHKHCCDCQCHSHHAHQRHESCCSEHGTQEKHSHECEEQDFAHELYELADEAWMELLKEKIKENILATNGKQLDELAKVVSDANNHRWKHKVGIIKMFHQFKEQISHIFGKHHLEQEQQEHPPGS